MIFNKKNNQTCCFSYILAPSSVSIQGVTFEKFNVDFSTVPGATSYDILYTTQHNTTDRNVRRVTSSPATITGIKSNFNYHVQVRAVENANTGQYSRIVKARTAPQGQNITQIITTPTFVTLLFEQTPAATKWELEYNNTATGVVTTQTVPDDAISNTSYVAIISPLSPNTRYNFRARVSQIAGATDYSLSASPYGAVKSVLTDKISAFGRVQLITRNYSTNSNDNTELKSQLARELREAYKNINSNVANVSVLQFENDGSGKILCHHEILLNDQSPTPNISGLVLRNSGLYGGATVKLGVGESPGYFYGILNGTQRNGIVYGGSLRCPSLSVDKKTWTSYFGTRSTLAVLPDGSTTSSPTAALNVDISDRSIMVRGIEAASLVPNSIFAIKQNYLLRTCPADANLTVYYNRLYGATSTKTALTSDRYTILGTTGYSTSLSPEIFFIRSLKSGTGVNLRFLSALFRRATSVVFTHNDTNTTLMETDLDNARLYAINVTNLPLNSASSLRVTLFTRYHNGSIGVSTMTLQARTDEDECARPRSPCATGASCRNRIPGYVCTCGSGYTGNGTFCDDINECENRPDICEDWLTCENKPGSYKCTCGPRQAKNGTSCLRIPTPVASFDSVKTTSFRLRWNFFELVNYQITVTGNDVKKNYRNVSSSPVNVTGLSPGVVYLVRIQVLEKNISAQATRQITVCNKVTNLSAVKGKNNAELRWDVVRGAHHYVMVFLRAEHRRKRQAEVIRRNVTATNVVIPNLIQGATYSASVAARNNAGVGEPSSITFTISPLRRRVLEEEEGDEEESVEEEENPPAQRRPTPRPRPTETPQNSVSLPWIAPPAIMFTGISIIAFAICKAYRVCSVKSSYNVFNREKSHGLRSDWNRQRSPSKADLIADLACNLDNVDSVVVRTFEHNGNQNSTLQNEREVYSGLSSQISS
ncbi:unnamed protein product [Clavelina lepadiformis]|uniref:Uncharacterized protein n=1 Tax=Clavelina lepadiformis TaxID=159417 RepID=A0ABP0GKJ3_CLALP